jgi:hypothetical protein
MHARHHVITSSEWDSISQDCRTLAVESINLRLSALLGSGLMSSKQMMPPKGVKKTDTAITIGQDFPWWWAMAARMTQIKIYGIMTVSLDLGL